MASKEEVRSTPRRKAGGARNSPELRFSKVPLVEDFLTGNLYSILLGEAERCQDPRYWKKFRRQNNTRLGLDKYFRHFKGLSVPGMDEAKEHVREKYRRNLRANTLEGTVTTLKLFLKFLQQQGKTSISELSRQDVEAFVEHEHSRGLKPNTVRSRYAIVHAFAVFLIDNGVISPEVIFRPIRIKLPDPLPRAIPPEHVQRLVGVLEGPRDRALILVLLRTGMRIGELLSTQMRDVHMPERFIAIPQASKNITGRVVYLSDDACEALNGWFEVRDERRAFLFYSQLRHRMSYGCARLIFKKHLDEAGLGDKGYGLHCLRHTMATDMLNAGMRIECLQQILGHSTLEMTRRYARLTDATRQKEYFRAMETLQKGVDHGRYQLDSELQAILEEKKLHGTHRKALLERLETVSGMGGRSDREGGQGQGG